MSEIAKKLRHRVRFDRLVTLLDSNGNVIQNEITGEVERYWKTFFTCFAAIAPVSVREFMQSQAEQSEVTTRIQVRYNILLEDLSNARIAHLRDAGEVIYNPAGAPLADVDSGVEYLTIPCSSNLTDGR